jgi:antirestriction protein
METKTNSSSESPKHSNALNGPAVYVGTYRKYNEGSIAGEWIDLEDYAGDRDGFLAKCAEIHSDEADPELMFQDFQGFPRDFYGESCLDEKLFAWLELDESERELIERYEDAFGYAPDDIEQAREVYIGTYTSGADYAESLAIENGDIPTNLPTWIADAIDWDAAWDRSLRFDCSYSEPHHDEIWIFSNY